MTNDYNPYTFMPLGYEEFRANPYSSDALLNQLHHALLDDGEVTFVKMFHDDVLVRVFMTFDSEYEEGFIERCLVQNKFLVDTRRNFKLLSRTLTASANEFKFESNNCPAQFVKDVEAFSIASSIERKARSERIAQWKAL